MSNKKQLTKINLSYGSLLEIIFGVPQESILEPLLFNIFLTDLFLIIEDTDIDSYTDDNTPYVSAYNIDKDIKSLEEASEILFKWFSTNNTFKIKIGNFDITNSRSGKLLGVKFDHKLTFNDQISELCKKASRKIHTLSRVASYMNISK